MGEISGTATRGLKARSIGYPSFKYDKFSSVFWGTNTYHTASSSGLPNKTPKSWGSSILVQLKSTEEQDIPAPARVYSAPCYSRKLIWNRDTIFENYGSKRRSSADRGINRSGIPLADSQHISMEKNKHSNEFNKAVYAETLFPNDLNIDGLLERIRELFDLVKGEEGRLKHKDGDFRLTDKALNAIASSTGLTHSETYQLLASALEGAIRPQSSQYLFNIMPAPHLDAVAASTIASLLNTNTLMDRYAGNLLKVEQNVSRTIGSWAGWPNSFGISCAGGKATMIYAVRAALTRLAPHSRVEGVPRNVVILANEMAHYVVEDICTLVGLGSGACRRVKCKEPWSMDPELISQAICDAHSEGKQVAAVICCGGTTINSCVDNLRQVVEVSHQTLEALGCSYRPYFHLDAVIGWLWLAFRGDEEERNRLTPAVRRPVEDFLRKLEGLEYFDSFGADLHKNGLCPISGSFFICREFETLASLTNGQVTLERESLEVNDWRPYRYTLENSRPGGGILAAWAVLNRLGRKGFQDNVTYLSGK